MSMNQNRNCLMLMARALVLFVFMANAPFLLTCAFGLDVGAAKADFLKGDYQGCIATAEGLLANAKRDSRNLDELYYYLGLSYLKTGNFLRASDIFEILLHEIKGARFKEEARMGLGDCLFLKGDYARAQGAYAQLLTDHPRSKLKPAVYYRLSQLAARTDNPQMQKEYLARLKAEFPRSPEASSNKELFPADAVKKAEPRREPVACYIQVGAFSSKTNATNLARALQAKGYPVSVVETQANAKPIYKVRVGKFDTRQEALVAEKKLARQGYPTKIIP